MYNIGERQQKEPLAGSTIKGRRRVGGLELMGSDVATTTTHQLEAVTVKG